MIFSRAREGRITLASDLQKIYYTKISTCDASLIKSIRNFKNRGASREINLISHNVLNLISHPLLENGDWACDTTKTDIFT